VSPLSARLPRARAFVAVVPMLAAATAVACGDKDPPTGVMAPRIAPAAQAYLDTALAFMQLYYYFGDTVNWTAKRTRAFQRAGAAQTRKAVYPAIDTAVLELGDDHSFFFPPSQTFGNREDPPTPFFTPMSAALAPRVAYLWIPTFGGRSSLGRADTIQRVIARADSTPNLCGWVLDLRGNPGGFWPAMLAGLSPLVTPGRVGGFVERDTTRRYFYEVQPGAALLNVPGGRVIEALRLPSSYQLQRPGLPIAILQGDITASAGEIIVMAFKEPDRAVRTFGAPTFGLTTQPYTYTFADTASLVITAAMMFDRQRRVYLGNPIPVDEPVAGPRIRADFVPGNLDPVIDAAINWLRTQPACAPPEAARLRQQTPGAGGWLPTRAVPGAIPASEWTKTRPSPWVATPRR
jgi:carboxyl-terminal processing protease